MGLRILGREGGRGLSHYYRKTAGLIKIDAVGWFTMWSGRALMEAMADDSNWGTKKDRGSP